VPTNTLAYCHWEDAWTLTQHLLYLHISIPLERTSRWMIHHIKDCVLTHIHIHTGTHTHKHTRRCLSPTSTGLGATAVASQTGEMSLHPPPQQHQQRTQAQAHTGRALLWRGRCRGPHPNGQLLRRGQRPASSRVGGVHAAATIAVRERGGGGV
jgi:hypothetical protein